MYRCKKCNKEFENEYSEGVEISCGKAYCKHCGEPLVWTTDDIDQPLEPVAPPRMTIESSQSPAPRRQGASPTLISNSDNRILRDSNNTTTTNIFNGTMPDKKVETEFGLRDESKVRTCSACRKMIPEEYYHTEERLCRNCFIKHCMKEGDSLFDAKLYKDAVTYYQKGNINGSDQQPLIRYKMGLCHFEMKDREAMKCFALSIDIVDSGYYLGRCHELGMGEAPDLKEARKNYQIAADKGSELAKDALERMDKEAEQKQAQSIQKKQVQQLKPQSTLTPTPDNPRDPIAPPPPPPPRKWILYVVAIAVILLIGYKFFGGSKEEPLPAQPAAVESSNNAQELKEATTATQSSQKATTASKSASKPASANESSTKAASTASTPKPTASTKPATTPTPATTQPAKETTPPPAAELTADELLKKGISATKKFQDGRALDYFKQAAAKGSSIANYHIGNLYYNGGNDITRSYPQAFSYYKKAADAGCSDGQYMLGVLYRNGHGCEKNISQAKAWLQKAAAQGNAQAEKLLEKF